MGDGFDRLTAADGLTIVCAEEDTLVGGYNTYIINRTDGIVIVDDDPILLAHRPWLQLLPTGLVVRLGTLWIVLYVIDPFFKHLQMAQGE